MSRLQQSIIPRCESLTRLSDIEIAAVVTVRIGLITLSEMDPPHGYCMRGEGQGGGVGSAHGSAKVRLTEIATGTLLAYEIEAGVCGKLGLIGGKLISATAHRWADAFLDRFTQHAAAAAGLPLPSTAH